MAQKKSLIEEALTDAEQVRETALANAKAQLEEAFTPRIQSMVSKKLGEELNEEDDEDYDEKEGEDEDEDDDKEEVDEAMGDADEDEDGAALPDPTNADDAELDEEEDMGDDEYDDESEDEDDVDLDLESVIADLEEEMNEEEDYDDESDDDESDDEDIVDLDELLQSISEEEDMDDDDEDEEDEETLDLEELFNSLEEGEESEDKVETLAAENKTLTSENAEYREAVEILRSKLNEVNLLNAKLLYTSKLFKKYSLNNSQKMKVVESFDRTKSVRETKLVYSTLAESFQIGGSSSSKTKRTKSITEGLASKPVKSTKPSKNSEIISESNDLADRFKKLVNHNK